LLLFFRVYGANCQKTKLTKNITKKDYFYIAAPALFAIVSNIALIRSDYFLTADPYLNWKDGKTAIPIFFLV